MGSFAKDGHGCARKVSTNCTLAAGGRWCKIPPRYWRGRSVIPRGIMFHHFSDAVHPRGQGAISEDDLVCMIRFLGRENILDAPEWMDRALAGRLGEDEVCLTFDDALRCQYDVAAPVLADFGISGFWFVYSSVFEGGLEPLEIYRYFRTVAFPDIDAFCDAFFE